MTLIRNACLAERFPFKQIDFEDAGMKLRVFREIHAERPHGFQAELLHGKRESGTALDPKSNDDSGATTPVANHR